MMDIEKAVVNRLLGEKDAVRQQKLEGRQNGKSKGSD